MNRLRWMLLAAVVAVSPPVSAAPQALAKRAETFHSPEEGFAALAEAIHAHDEPRLLRILGESARRLIDSGDPAADRAAEDAFTAAYDAHHEILRPTPNQATLQIGADGWPLPIPLDQHENVWRFSAAEGTRQLVDRRIGRNELDTIETLRAIADAQDDYAATAGHEGGLRAYAQRFFSTPGKHDGLYWETAPDEPESPLGPLVAAAAARLPAEHAAPEAYRGYVYRMLLGQGPSAPGGAFDYVVNGRMIGGFAALAYPAQYGASGIQSFLVDYEGAVYQRDLGPDSTRLAADIKAFDPAPGWQRVPD